MIGEDDLGKKEHHYKTIPRIACMCGNDDILGESYGKCRIRRYSFFQLRGRLYRSRDYTADSVHYLLQGYGKKASC